MSAVAQVLERKRAIEFKQILFATDFSEASQRAFDYAVALAHRYHSALSVIHAIAPDPYEPAPIYPLPHELDIVRLAAEQQMGKIAHDARVEDLNHHLLVERGPVWGVLASEMHRANVDLLVLGTRARGGLRKVALGSVAEIILRQSPCPVLTIGPNVPAPDAGPIKFNRILFASDFRPSSVTALPFAVSFAEEYRAKLVLLHMVSPMPIADLGTTCYCPAPFAADALLEWQENTREQSARALRTLLPHDTKLASKPEYVVAMDFVPEGILTVAKSHNIDLIVMGAISSSFPRIAAHIPWTLAHKVICQAHCPVLTVGNAAIEGSDYVR